MEFLGEEPVFVKLEWNKELRRFAVNRSINFNNFAERVEKVIGIEGLALKYIDDDGDYISISCDEDLSEAISYLNERNLNNLKINVFTQTSNIQTSNPHIALETPEMNMKKHMSQLSEIKWHHLLRCVLYSLHSHPHWRNIKHEMQKAIHEFFIGLLRNKLNFHITGGKSNEKNNGPARLPGRSIPKPKLVARFVEDVTFPDGSEIAQGTTCRKIWRIRNDGDVSWPEGIRIVYVGGDLLGPSSAPIKSAQPGEEIDVSISLEAPDKPGRYLSYWRLCTSEGEKFGQRFWVDFFSRKKK